MNEPFFNLGTRGGKPVRKSLEKRLLRFRYNFIKLCEHINPHQKGGYYPEYDESSYGVSLHLRDGRPITPRGWKEIATSIRLRMSPEDAGDLAEDEHRLACAIGDRNVKLQKKIQARLHALRTTKMDTPIINRKIKSKIGHDKITLSHLEAEECEERKAKAAEKAKEREAEAAEKEAKEKKEREIEKEAKEKKEKRK